MDQEKIGNVIKNIRKENNLTQKDLADKLGVTYQAVSKWERGQNIPDIQQLKRICDLYNLDITEFMNGEKKESKLEDNNNSNRTNKNIYLIMFIGIVIVVSILVGGYIYFNHEETFVFKTISGDSCDFKVYGSAAYNDDHTSIYISNVKYCGDDSNTTYKEITCILYEKEGNVEIKLGEIKENNINIEDYLEHVNFNIDSSTTTCSNLASSSLVLILNVKDDNDKVITYSVPLDLDNSCN